MNRAVASTTNGDPIAVVPGGIAEMFLGYPKPGTLPNEEYALLRNRKGFVRMAVKHGVPIVPVYCFGATKMLKRLQVGLLESISNATRVAICLFFGVWGLPIPFRQRLLYVSGDPLYPSTYRQGGDGGGGPPDSNAAVPALTDAAFEKEVEELHTKFCDEIMRLFERHKDSYGWSHKVLRLV